MIFKCVSVVGLKACGRQKDDQQLLWKATLAWQEVHHKARWRKSWGSPQAPAGLYHVRARNSPGLNPFILQPFFISYSVHSFPPQPPCLSHHHLFTLVIELSHLLSLFLHLPFIKMERFWAGGTGHRYCHLLAKWKQGKGPRLWVPIPLPLFASQDVKEWGEPVFVTPGRKREKSNWNGWSISKMPDKCQMCWHSLPIRMALEQWHYCQMGNMSQFTQGHIADMYELFQSSHYFHYIACILT